MIFGDSREPSSRREGNATTVKKANVYCVFCRFGNGTKKRQLRVIPP